MRYQLAILQPFDPRGTKISGIETHLRTLIERHPDDFSLKLVGTDGRGDLELGKPVTIEVAGRSIEFLPLVRYDDAEATEAASSLGRSVTLQLAIAVARQLGTVRRFLGPEPYSMELQRTEYAWLPILLRRPYVVIQHNEQSRFAKSESLLTKYWYVQTASERVGYAMADRILCVNETIKSQIETTYPRLAARCQHMTVSIDTDVFTLQPFDTADGVLRLFYGGRLSEQKDPPLMLRTIAGLKRALDGKIEFHYAGTSDLNRYPEYKGIEDVTIAHGYQDRRGVARLLGRCHAGILTSNFEGMPCVLLEAMAVGRPTGAIRLPQFDAVIREGQSGFLVDRQATPQASADALVAGFVALWAEIRAGRYRPEAVRQQMWPYSIEVQLPRLFALHRELQTGREATARAA